MALIPLDESVQLFDENGNPIAHDRIIWRQPLIHFDRNGNVVARWQDICTTTVSHCYYDTVSTQLFNFHCVDPQAIHFTEGDAVKSAIARFQESLRQEIIFLGSCTGDAKTEIKKLEQLIKDSESQGWFDRVIERSHE